MSALALGGIGRFSPFCIDWEVGNGMSAIPFKGQRY